MRSRLSFYRQLRRFFLQRSASLLSAACIVLTGVAVALRILPDAPAAFFLTGVVLVEFIRHMDRGVPYVQLAGLVATLQWVLGPALGYDSEAVFERYQMYVDSDVYFRFAIPSTCSYLIGLMILGRSVPPRELLSLVNRATMFNAAVVLCLIGNGMLFLRDSPSGVGFVLQLIAQFRFVGVLYFLFSRHRHRYLFVALSLAPVVFFAVSSTYFHDLLLWLAIVFIYWLSMDRRSTAVKLGLLGAGAVAMFMIQAVKAEYRKAVAADSQSASLVSLIVDKFLLDGAGWNQETFDNVVVRLNQGWIVSAVMANMPENESFVEGSTYLEAVKAALVPRFLVADKAEANLRFNFRRFTGLEIADSTSMGVSPLGEAYANFGEFGGVFCIGMYGLFWGGFVRLMLVFCFRAPVFVLWLPVIFYSAIKAETESIVVLNHLVKGSVFVGLSCLFIGQLFPMPFLRLRGGVRVADRAIG